MCDHRRANSTDQWYAHECRVHYVGKHVYPTCNDLPPAYEIVIAEDEKPPSYSVVVLQPMEANPLIHEDLRQEQRPERRGVDARPWCYRSACCSRCYFYLVLSSACLVIGAVTYTADFFFR